MTPGSSREKDVRRVRCYVDGFNLYHAIDALNKSHLKWLNLKTLATSFLETGEILDKVMFFTAVLKWDEEKKRRHVNYIKAQRAYGIDVIESTFKKSRRFCHEQERFCRSREEKQTDVAIAVSIVADAFENRFDRAILVTADTDQIPTVDLIASRFPSKRLTLVAPPGRMAEARDLGNRVKERYELSAGRIATCMMPRDVLDADGRKVATMPASYRDQA